jgi:hypothetical protein
VADNKVLNVLLFDHQTGGSAIAWGRFADKRGLLRQALIPMSVTLFDTWARFSNGIFTPNKEDVMKKHNKNSVSQLTYKTVRSLKASDEKAPRPLPSACAGWPQQQ